MVPSEGGEVMGAGSGDWRGRRSRRLPGERGLGGTVTPVAVVVEDRSAGGDGGGGRGRGGAVDEEHGSHSLDQAIPSTVVELGAVYHFPAAPRKTYMCPAHEVRIFLG